MKALEFSVAGKTFIAGEYLALSGGPALILCSEPRFRLQVQASSNQKNPFHAQSPSGQLWKNHESFFANYEMNFQDPYQVGGFGASSAQFALLHAFWQVKEEAFGDSQRFFDWHQMLHDYRSLSFEGAPPSGADVIGAVSGGLAWFDRTNGKLQSFAWPFQEIQFFLAHTGQKLATHEHLKNVGSIQTEEFEKAMQQIHRGLSGVLFDEFLNGLQCYRAQLEKQGRVAHFTQEKIKHLSGESKVLFAKGCGAMGSDVILTLCRKEDTAAVRALLQIEGLKVVADSSQVSPGLQIRNLDLSSKDLSL